MKYDYLENEVEDVKEYIKENIDLKEYSREELEEKLYEDLWTEDSEQVMRAGATLLVHGRQKKIYVIIWT